MNTIDTIKKYPKIRPELPAKYQEIYESHYKSNRDGDTKAASLSQKMESWLHKKVARDLTQGDINISTLEIGAGTLNQLPYEPITQYDIIEPFKILYQNSKELKRVNTIYSDIREIENKKYDRITSVAVFEHITDLPYVVAKSCLLLNENGTMRTAIPNEGTILWKLGWLFTTGLEFKLKYNLKYSTLLYNEHVNTASEINDVLSYFFDDIKCSVFGIHKKLGFYRFYECKQPNIEKAIEYINNYNV